MADEIEDKSIEELEAILADPSLLDAQPAPDPEPEQTAPAEPEPAPAADTAPEPVPAESEPPPEPQEDPVKDILATWEAERKALESKLELSRAHASRLAGEIGFLKKQQSAPRQPAGMDEPDAPAQDATWERLTRLEAELRKRDRDAAIASEVAAMRRPELDGLQEELKQAAAAFSDDWTQALDTEDPESARLMTRRVLNAVVAEAERIKTVRERSARLERRAASVAQIEQAKKRASISATAAAPTPEPPKRLDDMSPEELDKLLSAMTGG